MRKSIELSSQNRLSPPWFLGDVLEILEKEAGSLDELRVTASLDRVARIIRRRARRAVSNPSCQDMHNVCRIWLKTH